MVFHWNYCSQLNSQQCFIICYSQETQEFTACLQPKRQHNIQRFSRPLGHPIWVPREHAALLEDAAFWQTILPKGVNQTEFKYALKLQQNSLWSHLGPGPGAKSLEAWIELGFKFTKTRNTRPQIESKTLSQLHVQAGHPSPNWETKVRSRMPINTMFAQVFSIKPFFTMI